MKSSRKPFFVPPSVRLSAAQAAALGGLAGLALPLAAFAQCPPTFTMTGWGMGGSPILTVVGDFNHDGKLDMASPNFSGHNVTLRFADPNSPAGTNFNSLVTLAVGLNPSSMFAGDLNADGVTDLAVGYINGGAPRVGVFISNGNGTFQPMAVYAPTPQSTQIKGADINRDGIVDIVALATNNVLVLPGHAGAWTGGGAGAFSVRPVASLAGSFFSMADVNADGALDLVTTGGDPGRVFLSLGAPPSSQTFGASATYGSGPVFGTGWPTPGDFNNDGVTDIVVTHEITNARVQVFLGSADGTLAPMPVVFAGSASPRCPGVADFNGDGMLDVACVHGGGVGVHLGNGAGGLTNATNFTVAQATSLTTADMNNDGKPDIIAASQTLGTFTILMNTTPATAFNPPPFPQRACPGGISTVQFYAAATTTQSGGITGYTWQALIDGAWTTLSNGPLANVGTISGATTQQLTIAGVLGEPGDRVISVRAVAGTSCGGNPSLPATLDIIAPCGRADLGGPGGVPTPCGGDGVLDNNDFIVFITYFFQGNMIADFGVAAGFPGTDGLLDNNDFVAFIDAFFSGCPG